jgi:probable F420-dependent oxidoreductase
VHIGAVFPQTEIGSDPIAIRDYAQAVEQLGYHHILIYDHILGASTATRPNWSGAYNSDDSFHEVFVLFGYLAAITHQVELVTGVLVLPQRQTALVAKQAAEVDILSGGRLRLGVGVGWNAVEYEALNEDFHTRGARCAEQIAELRALWSEPVVMFKGRWHTIDAAGINPLPMQRPIPIWIGGYTEATLKRAARIGDGYLPATRPPDDQSRELIERLRGYLHEVGRAPESFGIEARLSLGQVPKAEWAAYADGWRGLGATHLCVNTMDMGLASPQDHVEALQQVKDVLEVVFE